MRRNPIDPQRRTEANEVRTQQRLEEYQLLTALLETWEVQPEQVQADNHDYIITLRAKLRTVRNYLLHRAQETI